MKRLLPRVALLRPSRQAVERPGAVVVRTERHDARSPRGDGAQRPGEVLVGISCGGAWITRDDGASWALSAQGMRAGFMPPERADDQNTQDPHRIVRCAAQPEVLWCQHHCGIWRSTEFTLSRTSCAATSPSFSSENLIMTSDRPSKLVELMSNDKQVTKRTPPTFLFHTKDDKGVPVENAIRFHAALQQANGLAPPYALMVDQTVSVTAGAGGGTEPLAAICRFDVTASYDLAQARDTLDAAIEHSSNALFSKQKADGHWVFELEADATIPAEFVLLTHFLDRPDPPLEQAIGFVAVLLGRGHVASGYTPLPHTPAPRLRTRRQILQRPAGQRAEGAVQPAAGRRSIR